MIHTRRYFVVFTLVSNVGLNDFNCARGARPNKLVHSPSLCNYTGTSLRTAGMALESLIVVTRTRDEDGHPSTVDIST